MSRKRRAPSWHAAYLTAPSDGYVMVPMRNRKKVDTRVRVARGACARCKRRLPLATAFTAAQMHRGYARVCSACLLAPARAATVVFAAPVVFQPVERLVFPVAPPSDDGAGEHAAAADAARALLLASCARAQSTRALPVVGTYDNAAHGGVHPLFRASSAL
jgi:hypothetical protein